MTTKVNQKTATINAILSVLKDRGVDYKLGGEVIMSDILTKEDKAKVKEILFANFRNKEVEYKESFQEKVDDDTKLNSYLGGLINNWVRKDKRLNAGETYKVKNPGSRAGSQNAEVKEMRKLLKVASEEDKVVIQAAIDAKVAELKASKSAVSIDATQIPESLRHLIPSTSTEESTEE